MMTLQEAVNLVLFAFEHCEQGDIFVQKAPAASIGDLAEVMKEIFNSLAPIRVIGTRHGEKLFETLLSREEAMKAVDLGGYYRVPADTRDLNYGSFFTEGSTGITSASEYTSHNTQRLDRKELKDLLLGLDYIQKELAELNS